MAANRARLAVILHADIVGSTALVQRNESIAHDRMRDAFVRFSETIRAFAGIPHELRGDALLAEFSRVSDAIAASLTFQANNAELNEHLDHDIRPQLRIGISLGEVIVADGTLTGPDVVLAQRLEQLAEPGGLCISGIAQQAAPSRLPYSYRDLGEQQAKGFDEPVRVFAVELKSGDSVPAPEGQPTIESHRKRRYRPWLLFASTALILVVSGLAAWFYQTASLREMGRAGSDQAAHSHQASIVVLPFDNLSNDEEQEYFANGLTDDLITDLAKIPELFVIARNSSFAFKNQAVSVSQVAQQLGVRYVVEGSIRRSADRVRVNAQLVDGNSGRHIWGERYDRQITDVFTVQEELVTQIASALAVKLSRTQGGAAGQRKVPEFRAYELYLKARDAYFSGDDSRLRESMDLYEQAASVDPSFARAYSGYAQVAVFIWRLRGVRLMNQALARASAETAARTALALDPTLAEAHSVLALLAVGEADYDNALKSAQRAVSLEPNSAEAHSALCVVLVYAGHPEAALAAIRTAVRLDPKPSLYIRTYLGLALFFNRRYEEAIAALEPIANTQSGGFDVPREILAMVYAELGRLDEARTHVARILEDLPLLNLQVHRARYQHHARPEDLERRIDALASAGMPHWPFGYEGDPRQQLRDDEIKLLAFGHTWSGINMNERGEPTKFIEQFDHDGTAVFATAHSMNRGTAFVQDDALCERLSGVAMSRTLCGPVYRNKTDSGRGGDYIYVNGASIRYFSVTE